MVIAQEQTDKSKVQRYRKPINKLMHGQLTHGRGINNIQWEKAIFSITSVGKLDNYLQSESGPLPHTTTKISSWWIKDVNVKTETIELLEESIRSQVFDIDLSSIKKKINLHNKNKTKEDYITIKSFWTRERNYQQNKI